MLLLSFAASAGVVAAAPVAARAAPQPRRAIVVVASEPLDRELLGPSAADGPVEPQDRFLRRLMREPSLSVGLVSSTQGDYTKVQFLLDMTQGSRQSSTLYRPHDPPSVSVRREGGGGRVSSWEALRRRARAVSETLVPGLVAGRIPGGAAYAGVDGLGAQPAIAAADEQGWIAAMSVGSPASLASRAQGLLREHRLVVVGVPPSAAGDTALAALVRTRAPPDLLIVVAAPPTPPAATLTIPSARFYKFTPIGVAGLGGRRSLTSGTTHVEGLVAGIDVGPTVLAALGLPVPSQMRGEPIRTAPRLGARRLETLRDRWQRVRSRRRATLFAIVALGGVLLFVLGAARRRVAVWGRVARWTGLAVMWWPTTALAVAYLEPRQPAVEAGLIGLGALALGLLSDRLLPWPRAPILPAAVGIGWLTFDLAQGSGLITRSILSPSLIFGGRFYGISNEYKSALMVLFLAGVAAAMAGRERSRRLATAMALVGAAFAVVIGSGRLGAGVGGVVVVGAGTAVATVLLLPGGITRRTVVVVLLVPVAALGGLIGLDLLTSAGGHLQRDILRAQNANQIWELVSRRYQLIFQTLSAGMIATSIVAAVAVAAAIRNRTLLYGSLARDPVWQAALLGGLAAGIAGTFAEDSGPVLFVHAVIALAAVTAYLAIPPEREAALLAAEEPARRDEPPPARAVDPVAAGAES
jgi:hypothetical protein